MRRPDDTVTIESVIGDGFSVVLDRTTQYEINLSLTNPNFASFELGDESTWAAFREYLRIGRRFSVSVNGQARVTGRMLTRNMPLSVDSGATVQMVIQTRVADAQFTACTPGIEVRNVTLKDLVLRGFERMGLTEADFTFRADLDRDAITGRKSGQPSAAAGIRARLNRLEQQPVPQGGAGDILREKRVLQQQLQGAETRPVVPDLAEITVQQAEVQPGETVWSFVERHLDRHGLMMWDGADGKIVVGTPDDSQAALYQMVCLKGPESRANNILSAQKGEDYEAVPSALWVYGRDGGKGYALTSAVKAYERDAVLSAVDPPLDRVAMVVDQGIRTQALAEARARREMMQRSLQKDSWVLETDGLSYWSGRESIPYVVDTVADLRIDTSDRADGPYLIHEVNMTGTAESAHTTRLSAVAKGIWVL